LKPESLLIFCLGMVSFSFSTAASLLLAKLMNLFMNDRISSLIGAAGVSAVPMAARVARVVARGGDRRNFILVHPV